MSTSIYDSARLATAYAFHRPPVHRGIIAALGKHVQFTNRPLRALDIGCGAGLSTAALEPLAEADLRRTVTIRGEPHSVMQAIHRQVTHYTYHVGQIVLLARQFRGGEWHWLTIPPGRSEEFLRRVKAGEASQR